MNFKIDQEDEKKNTDLELMDFFPTLPHPKDGLLDIHKLVRQN